jgi:hypothetical protein
VDADPLLELDFFAKMIGVDIPGIDVGLSDGGRATEGFLRHKKEIATNSTILNRRLNVDKSQSLELGFPRRRCHSAMLASIRIPKPFREGPEDTVQPNVARIIAPSSSIKLDDE